MPNPYQENVTSEAAAIASNEAINANWFQEEQAREEQRRVEQARRERDRRDRDINQGFSSKGGLTPQQMAELIQLIMQAWSEALAKRQARSSGVSFRPGNIFRPGGGIDIFSPAVRAVGIEGRDPGRPRPFESFGALKYPRPAAAANLLPTEREIFRRTVEMQGIPWEDYEAAGQQRVQDTSPGVFPFSVPQRFRPRLPYGVRL